MHSETVLFIGITGSILTSSIMWMWLKEPLREVIAQLCDQPGTPDFWSRYTLLMLLTAPLAIVIFFSPDHIVSTVDALRRILLAILSGHFAAFALVGRSLFNAANRIPPITAPIKKE